MIVTCPGSFEKVFMIRRRVRIRFAKRGDLRWLSHLDLLRAWERLFRRAGLPLSMTEGFHPKPRMNFPSALAVGIAGEDEIVEIELCEERRAEDLAEQLPAFCPPGLEIRRVEIIPEGVRKQHVRSATFTLPIPSERIPELKQQIERLLGQTEYFVTRETRKEPLDIRPWIDGLGVEDGELTMRLRVSHEGSVRPREILQAIGVADLERDQGATLVRSRVELDAEPGLVKEGVSP